MKILDKSFDNRSQCCSVLVKMTLKEYKEIAEEAFKNGGNISGQRDVIKKSTAASKIRSRMNDDFNKKAVFPAVVLGSLLTEKSAKDLSTAENEEIETIIKTISKEKLSIIDGMQRSNIYFNNYENNSDSEIRVEFWFANQSVKLLYRMLVLNTGQVPWNTRRQIEVIFGNLSNSIIDGIKFQYKDLGEKINILSVDDNRRRTQAGIMHKSVMIEMYLAFNTRNIKVEVNDALANEFQRFDMLESIENDINFNLFVDVIAYLFKLDFAFASCEDTYENSKFGSGKDIFSSAPACIGFVVACAEYIMGKSQVKRDDSLKMERLKRLKSQLDKLINLLGEKDNYLKLDILDEMISALPTSKIGDEMRRLFRDAFSDLIKCDDLEEQPSLEAFWRA